MTPAPITFWRNTTPFRYNLSVALKLKKLLWGQNQLPPCVGGAGIIRTQRARREDSGVTQTPEHPGVGQKDRSISAERSSQESSLSELPFQNAWETALMRSETVIEAFPESPLPPSVGGAGNIRTRPRSFDLEGFRDLP